MKALNVALAVALRTMRNEPQAASRLLHTALAGASDAFQHLLRASWQPTATVYNLFTIGALS